MQIEKNVREFLTKCSDGIGVYEGEMFDVGLWRYFYEDCCPVKSPIEQILYCALKTIARFSCLDDSDVYTLPNGKEVVRGLGIWPQRKIEKYRCDFLITYETSKINKELIVECDSQQFHERTEKERRYEKARDRFFVSQGYKVFHYTGAEILKEPFEKAIEIIAYITEIPIEEIKDSHINYINL